MQSMRPTSGSTARLGARPDWLAVVVIAAAGVAVFRGALAQFFSADDFPALARAAGLLPRLTAPWRLASGQLYFDLLRVLGGLDPHVYHLAGLLLHLACALSLYALLRARLSARAALAGATLFATHPAHFTTLYWVSAVGGPLSLLLVFATIAAAGRRGFARWLAVPLFALALLARESVALLPLLLPALGRWGAPSGPAGGEAGSVPPARGWRDPLVAVLALLSAGLIAHFALTDALGSRAGATAYAPGFGRDLGANLLTYLGWSANFFLPTVARFHDAADPLVYGWGAGLLALWLAGLALSGLRRRGWGLAGALYAAFLLPVLPLGHHTYHYYLYAPLAGAGWCVAAALDRAPPGGGRARRARASLGRTGSVPDLGPGGGLLGWAVSLTVAALLALNGALLVRKIETRPFPGPWGLRSDVTVDRGSIARNAIHALSEAGVPDGARLLFWSPIARAAGGPADGGENYLERNVRTALFDGLAVRVFFPGVDSVRFVTAYRSLPAPYRWAVYRPDGRLRLAASAELDSVLRAGPPSN